MLTVTTGGISAGFGLFLAFTLPSVYPLPSLTDLIISSNGNFLLDKSISVLPIGGLAVWKSLNHFLKRAITSALANSHFCEKHEAHTKEMTIDFLIYHISYIIFDI